MKDERLQIAVDAATAPYNEYMSSFEEIKDYYQDHYSQRQWIGALVRDLTGLSSADGRAYLSARRRVERWTAGSSTPNAASQEQLVRLGEKLPPVRYGVPQDGLDVSVQGTFVVSKREGKRYRDIGVHLDYDQALDFVNDPSYEVVFEEYGVDGDMFAGGMEKDIIVAMQ